MEETTETDQSLDRPKRKRTSPEMIVAVAAIVVSVMTLFVYIFQAQIMMEQQHTSVWPYIEVATTNVSAEEDEFYIAVTNKGVGPALIKDTGLYLDDSLYSSDDYSSLTEKLLGGRETRDALWIIYSPVGNRVLAPGEEVKILHVKSWKGTRIPKFDDSRTRFNVCYCNIYDNCWSTDGTTVKDGGCK